MQIASADIKFKRVSKILLNMPGNKFLIMLDYALYLLKT